MRKEATGICWFYPDSEIVARQPEWTREIGTDG
jgi:hypothetical protein